MTEPTPTASGEPDPTPVPPHPVEPVVPAPASDVPPPTWAATTRESPTLADEPAAEPPTDLANPEPAPEPAHAPATVIEAPAEPAPAWSAPPEDASPAPAWSAPPEDASAAPVWSAPSADAQPVSASVEAPPQPASALMAPPAWPATPPPEAAEAPTLAPTIPAQAGPPPVSAPPFPPPEAPPALEVTPFPAFPGEPGPIRKRRTGLIVGTIIGLVLVLLAAGGVGVFVLVQASRPRGTVEPRQAVEGFLGAVFTGTSSEPARGFICPAARQNAQVDQLLTQLRELEETYESPRMSWNYPAIEPQGRTASADVTLTLTTANDQTSKKRVTVLLVEDRGWWVCDVEPAAAQP